MNTVEIIILAALAGYAVYKQTRVSEVRDKGRFRLAAIYAIVGFCVGGFVLPHAALAVTLLVISVVLSAAVGLARGYLTHIWVDGGRVLRQGTALTVGLFLALVAVKFGMGAYEYFAGVRETAGFGEILVMIAVMVAVQAEIVRRRARTLSRSHSTVYRQQPVRHPSAA